MKTLSDLLPGIRIPEFTSTNEATPVTGISYDSRRVAPGHLFFAFKGARHDGAAFAAAAVQAGAIAVVSEEANPGGLSVPWIQLPQARHVMAAAAVRFFQSSLSRARLIGITGTNGKTTTAWLVDRVLRSTGRPTALIGTVRYTLGDESLPAANTTPEFVEILSFVDRLVAAGGEFLTMEVSSHALALGRVYGIPYEVAAFTNLTQDHLDMHGSLEAYAEAKRLLFRPEYATPPTVAVLNADDHWANTTPLHYETRPLRFGMNNTADLRAVQLESSMDGLRFELEWQGKRRPFRSPLIGEFNAYNLLTAYGICLGLGLSQDRIHDILQQSTGVPGRFERVDRGQPFAVVVDYAHTPDALVNVLRAAKRLRPNRVITVFGCGGDRDRRKRPRMAEAAGSLSDQVFLTSDNPRSEDPMQIIEDALVGLRPFEIPCTVEPDRARAIHAAIDAAVEGDIVVIAGKGHETYQIFADRTIHFDDHEVAADALAKRGYSSPAGGVA